MLVSLPQVLAITQTSHWQFLTNLELHHKQQVLLLSRVHSHVTLVTHLLTLRRQTNLLQLLFRLVVRSSVTTVSLSSVRTLLNRHLVTRQRVVSYSPLTVKFQLTKVLVLNWTQTNWMVTKVRSIRMLPTLSKVLSTHNVWQTPLITSPYLVLLTSLTYCSLKQLLHLLLMLT